MERCFAVDEVTMVKEGRTDFDDLNDLLALTVNVTFDLGNLAFVHVDGRNNASFYPADI